jgi:hypothetical protein
MKENQNNSDIVVVQVCFPNIIRDVKRGIKMKSKFSGKYGGE